MNQELKTAARSFITANASYQAAFNELRRRITSIWGLVDPVPASPRFTEWDHDMGIIENELEIDEKFRAMNGLCDDLRIVLFASGVRIGDDLGSARDWCARNMDAIGGEA